MGVTSDSRAAAVAPRAYVGNGVRVSVGPRGLVYQRRWHRPRRIGWEELRRLDWPAPGQARLWLVDGTLTLDSRLPGLHELVETLEQQAARVRAAWRERPLDGAQVARWCGARADEWCRLRVRQPQEPPARSGPASLWQELAPCDRQRVAYAHLPRPAGLAQALFLLTCWLCVGWRKLYVGGQPPADPPVAELSYPPPRLAWYAPLRVGLGYAQGLLLLVAGCGWAVDQLLIAVGLGRPPDLPWSGTTEQGVSGPALVLALPLACCTLSTIVRRAVLRVPRRPASSGPLYPRGVRVSAAALELDGSVVPWSEVSEVRATRLTGGTRASVNLVCGGRPASFVVCGRAAVQAFRLLDRLRHDGFHAAHDEPVPATALSRAGLPSLSARRGLSAAGDALTRHVLPAALPARTRLT